MQTGMELIRGQRGLMLWLAREMRMSPSTLSGWKQVPAVRVHEIERLTGLPRYWLRPDLFAPPWWSERHWFREHGVNTGADED